MGRPNGLDVPEAVVALLAVLPFKVTAWVMRSPGEGDEFEVIKGPCGWGVRASSGYMDSLRGASYGKATLRDATLAALEDRAHRHTDAADACDTEGKRARLADRKRHAAERAASLRAEAALIRETITAIAAAWPVVSR
jgi:hypothetical protein